MTTTPAQDETLKQFTELSKLLAYLGEPYDNIWLRFWDWHLLHADAEATLVGLARFAQSKGRSCYGISAIWEVMRWNVTIRDGQTEEFKCSNDYRSRYARLLMWKYPDLDGFFEIRPLRSARDGGISSSEAEREMS